MPSLAFILFFSTYYSPQGILLIQIFIEYSRHEFENLLRGSSIHVISEDVAPISTEAYVNIYLLTDSKDNCQLRTTHEINTHALANQVSFIRYATGASVL